MTGATTNDHATPSSLAVASAVMLAVLIGAAVRALPAFAADFPLNDGGLFLEMTRDLVANGFRPPATTDYNGADIPFLYPPLGFYVAGIASLVQPDLFVVFRIVPFVLSVLLIPVVYLWARQALPTAFAALVATVAFALIPRSFEWILAGGGVTRGLGVLFALLVLWAALRLERDRTWRRALSLGVFAALAALSHPEAVLVGMAWLIVILMTTKDRRGLFVWLVRSALIAAALSLPWLAVSIASHGLDEFLAVSQAGNPTTDALLFMTSTALTDEPLLPVIGVLALIGVLSRAVRRDLRWLLWIALTILVDPRGGPNYLAAIVGGAAAIALVEVILPSLDRFRIPADLVWPDARIGAPARLTLAVVLAFGVAGAVATPSRGLTPLFALDAPVRASIARVAEATDVDDQIVIISGTGWQVDATSEWFPILADRHSVATVQGTEWLGPGAFERAEGAFKLLQACAFDSTDCFEDWRAEYAPDATHLFFPRGTPTVSPLETECCPALRIPLTKAGYPVVFDDAGGTLLEVP